MVAAATLLSCAMTTTTTTTATTALISGSSNGEWQQQHCENKSSRESNSTTATTRMRNNGELNVQPQKNTSTEIEEIDCSALLDGYEGEISNNSADWKLFRWTPESTRMMLRLRFERQVEFQQRHRQKKDLWAEIANEMRNEGNFFTIGEVCDLKYRNMLQTYKKNYIKEERGMQSQIVWEYYDVFKEAMKTCAATVCDELVPSQLCESICDNSDQLLGVVKKEQELYEDEDVTVGDRGQNRETVNDDEMPVLQKQPANSVPKRRAPSARVLAINNKRMRHSSSNSHTETSMTNDLDWMQHLPPLEPKPDGLACTTSSSGPAQPNPASAPALSHPPLHNYPLPPPWLTDSELREYFAYGESVGLQIAHIRDPRTRAFLQLKIQETLFLAKVGKLTE